MTPASDLISNLMEVAAELIDVLETETRCLQTHGYAELGGLFDRKTRLTKMYEGLYDRLAENPALIQHLAPRDKTAFASRARHLQTALETNEGALKSRRDSAKTIIEISVANARRQNKGAARPQPSAYSRMGARVVPAGAYARPAPMAAMFNQAI